MARAYQPFPSYEYAYLGQALTFTPTDSLTLNVQTPRDYILRVNRVDYVANVCLVLIGGAWQLSGRNSYEQYHAAHFSRYDRKGDASESARKALIAFIIAAAECFTFEHADALAEAGRVNVNNELHRLEERRDKLAAEVAAIDAQIAALAPAAAVAA